MSAYLPKLKEITDLFHGVSEDQRRDLLLSFAEGASKWIPDAGETFEIEDSRHDQECSDFVGVHLKRDHQGGLRLRLSLGPEIQTLTRALAGILCEGLDGAQPEELTRLNRSLIDQIVGARLQRLRSRTVYYLLDRIQEAATRLPSV